MSNTFAPTAPVPVSGAAALGARRAWTLLILVFIAVYFAALFSPALLDDADANHAAAAQHIVTSGDWVTLRINGIRYLEKAPLPYWLAAVDYRIFGENVFATHLPLALSVLALAALAWVWGGRAFGPAAGLYAGLGVLTSVGVFLFTRVFIPEVLITALLAVALYCFLTGLEDRQPARFYGMWAALGLAMLTKGLIAPVFFFAAVLPYLWLTSDWRRWQEFHPVWGPLLTLAIAAPWHILAGLRNPDQGHPTGNVPGPAGVHGFYYFYFVNEHILRFLGRRYPHDYNKLPAILYWSLHLVWLFPWSLFFPLAIKRAWTTRSRWMYSVLRDLRPQRYAARERARNFRRKTLWLLGLYAAVILLFFSLSTNQEYYTFPAYFPLLVLAAGALSMEEAEPETASRWLGRTHLVFVAVGFIAAVALGYGLWTSRHIPYVTDIGSLLADRDVAGYTLSMSHFFDLTGPSFAALRLPAGLAAVTLLLGPLAALLLRRQRHHVEATLSVAFTAAVFLIAAHIALMRFEPLLSSRAMAATINGIAGNPQRDPNAAKAGVLMLYGDIADGSSIVFYTHRQALLVNGRVNSMLWGSYYPDAPHIFLSDRALLAGWGSGTRKFLFVPEDAQAHVAGLLGRRAILLQRLADKSLFTDRPL